MKLNNSGMAQSLIIQDLTALGQLSMTTAISMNQISNINTAVLPTQLLSTQTEGFGEPQRSHMDEWIKRTWQHWDELGVNNFSSTLVGYLGSSELVELVENLILNHNNLGTVIVDPVMADQGSLYPGFKDSYVNGMRKLVSFSDFTVPNVTELSLLTEISLESDDTDENLEKAILKCTRFAPQSQVIVTGVKRGSQVGCIWLEEGKLHWQGQTAIEGHYFGTGDLFSAVLNAYLVNFPDSSLEHLIVQTTAVVQAAVEETSRMSFEQQKFGLKLQNAATMLLRDF